MARRVTYPLGGPMAGAPGRYPTTPPVVLGGPMAGARGRYPTKPKPPYTQTSPGVPGGPVGPDPQVQPDVNWQEVMRQAILTDPLYTQALSDAETQGIADKAQRDAAIQRYYIMYGGHPDLTALGFDVSGVIDPTTQALADAATKSGISTTARLGAQNDTAIASIRNALAARGLGHSGEMGTQLQHQQLAFTQAD